MTGTESIPGTEDWFWDMYQFVWGGLCEKHGDCDESCWDWLGHGLAGSFAEGCGFSQDTDWEDPAFRKWLIREFGSRPVPLLRASASHIEKLFWAACLKLAAGSLRGLVPEYRVDGYRIDFALPDRKTGIELDGFRSHSSPADIENDRVRQRYLEGQGWYIIRIGGREVTRNPDYCAQQAAYLAAHAREEATS